MAKVKQICPATEQNCHYLLCTGGRCMRRTPSPIPFKRAHTLEPRISKAKPGKKK